MEGAGIILPCARGLRRTAGTATAAVRRSLDAGTDSV